jgi:hypothetical protein
MPSIPRSVVVHKLNADPHLKPVQQRRRRYLAKKKKKQGNCRRSQETMCGRLHKRSSVHHLVVKHGVGQEIQREMENVS